MLEMQFTDVSKGGPWYRLDTGYPRFAVAAVNSRVVSHAL